MASAKAANSDRKAREHDLETDDNFDWVAQLRNEATREDSVARLHAILVRGLTHSLKGRYSGGVQPEDVAQEAVIKILDSLDSFQGRSRFTTWAMTVATRIGISQLRRKHFQDVSLDSLASDDSFSFDPADTRSRDLDEGIDRQALLTKLSELINSELTEKQRLAMRALLEGMPVEEIALRTGSNRNAVYKLVHDARSRLRRGFEKANIQAEDLDTILA